MGATDARIDSSITHRPARQSDLTQESDLFAPSLRVNLDNNVIVGIPLAQCTPQKIQIIVNKSGAQHYE